MIAGSIRIARKGRLLLESCGRTQTYRERTRGLLGRAQLKKNEGLLLDPCNSIHMFFMRFPLDVIFIDRQGCIVKLVTSLSPWRMSSCRKGSAVLEVSVGLIAEAGLQIGDQLIWEPGP